MRRTFPHTHFVQLPMRLVLDTNIVMDMLHFANPHTAPLLAALTAGRCTAFTDRDCLAELERVCTYPAFALDAAAQSALIARYTAFVVIDDTEADAPVIALPRCRDPDDQKFLVLAARCGADLLITRDKLLLRLAGHRRLPPPFRIVTAEAALPLLGLAPEDPTLRI